MIGVTYSEDNLNLRVQDDGDGFSERDSDQPKGICLHTHRLPCRFASRHLSDQLSPQRRGGGGVLFRLQKAVI